MIEPALIAFSTLIATIGPIESAALFAMLTPSLARQERRVVAAKASLIATAVLLFFALAGELILRQLGITTAALEAAGGLILMLIALDMVFARKSGGITATALEYEEAEKKSDIWVVPLATPIIAGPGAMAGAALVASRAGDDLVVHLVIVGVLLFTMAVTFVVLLAASELREFLSDVALNVITRVMGIVLMALAMQFVFNGLSASEIFA